MGSILLKALIICLLGLVPLQALAATEKATISGRIYQDLNHNQHLDAGEPGIPDIGISNGLQVVRSGDQGNYTLPVHQPMQVFVIKPSGYSLPLDSNNIPQFSYFHCPEGSPKNIQEFRGMQPTGPLPDTLNFPLYKTKPKTSFSMLVIGDTQVSDERELSSMRDSFVTEALDTEADLAVTLGDNVNDDLSLYPAYLRLMRLLDTPLLSVPGNHDLDRGAQGDAHSLDTYRSSFGPPYYSYNIGQVHLIVLDDVVWDGSDYHAELGHRQLAWLRNDLALVPADRLIVLAMHIPIVSWVDRNRHQSLLADRKRLFSLLEGRRVVALAGHTHTVEHLRPGEEFGEWGGPLPFPHIIAGAVSGSWWTGPPDYRGVPRSIQREGAPRGYGIMTFHGDDFAFEYIPLDRPPRHRMHLGILDAKSRNSFHHGIIDLSSPKQTRIVANVFSGSRDTAVACQVDDGPWLPMKRSLSTPDPIAMRHTLSLKKWLHPKASSHIWAMQLPGDLEPGAHTATVRARNVFGHTWTSSMIFQVGADSGLSDFEDVIERDSSN